jgi:hypothetical protein
MSGMEPSTGLGDFLYMSDVIGALIFVPLIGSHFAMCDSVAGSNHLGGELRAISTASSH